MKEKYNKLLLTPINLCSLQNFPFIEKDFDALTDYQIMCILAGYTEVLRQKVVEMSEVVDNIDVNFNELKNSVTNLNKRIDQLQIEISDLSKTILNNVDIKLEQQNNKVLNLLNEYKTIFDYNLEQAVSNLENQIKKIEIGNVNVYNPTNGLNENVNKVIQDIYDSVRYDAITCNEFDGLELTCEEYDNKQITAYNFDLFGKSILTN